MTSQREQVLTAVVAAVAAQLPAATVERDADDAPLIPDSGLVSIAATTPSVERLLGPGGPYWHRQGYRIMAMATADGDGSARFAVHDGLIVGIAAAVDADRSFGGLAAGAELAFEEQLEFVDEGAQTIRVAALELTVEYQSSTEI